MQLSPQTQTEGTPRLPPPPPQDGLVFPTSSVGGACGSGVTNSLCGDVAYFGLGCPAAVSQSHSCNIYYQPSQTSRPTIPYSL